MHTFLNKKTLKAGFTLIELLVVIAIIGILASVVLASLNTGRQKARDAKRAADLRGIQTTMVLYSDSATTGGANYPAPDTGAGVDCVIVASCLPDKAGAADTAKLAKFYPSGLPKNPNGDDYLYFGDSDSFCTSVVYENDTAKGFACDQNQCKQTIVSTVAPLKGTCIDSNSTVSTW